MEMFDSLQRQISGIRRIRHLGRVAEVGRGVMMVTGLSRLARLGDRVAIRGVGRAAMGGEVLHLSVAGLTVLPDDPAEGVAIGDEVELLGTCGVSPHAGWIGRIVDAFGQPLDDRPLAPGPVTRPVRAAAPPAARRKPLGARLETGIAAFNTLLPIVRGQRIGLFAGAGVGKSTLLGNLARGLEADVVVVALIGERGRELREFTRAVLGAAGMARAVVVASTSDQPALMRRRAAWTAMAVAEHFRDTGAHVLLLTDSVTRFAEAHREIALAAGEAGSLRGYPPSVAPMITALAERAGPGGEGQGDITALFSVLVAGADMDEPVADILRGVLDGHVVLDREIAERGRFPAIDLLRSVSRSLPEAASAGENALISEARRLLGAYARSEMMIQAGLYAPGSDPLVDRAIACWPALDAFLAEEAPEDIAASFARLAASLVAPDEAETRQQMSANAG
ncbi:FliI/YscN family ATPase [Alkalilacustris brevis]|uniref:FliI/YscN family ATPase n=1 Tax=Alkalilacustris brevis TaxID=2026338 RepID=UPI000E0DE8DB|nr:FliI/YscN family ATPase [Alkalilacustris brevis]